MTLKKSVEDLLETQKRSFAWLAGEMDKTVDGLKLSLVNQSIKYKDLIKMQEILKVPVTFFFEQTNNQTIKGNNNQQLNQSMVKEPEGDYWPAKFERQILQLESQLRDKDQIIELLKKQIK